MVLQIGQKLYGYCGGYFDNYHLTEYFIIEAIGFDWIVVRDDSDIPHSVCGRKELEILKLHYTQPQEEV